MAPVEPEPAEIERKPHESGKNVATVTVDSGASGHTSMTPSSPISNVVYRTTPPSVRLARFLRLVELFWTAPPRVSYKASSRTTMENSTSCGSQS